MRAGEGGPPRPRRGAGDADAPPLEAVYGYHAVLELLTARAGEVERVFVAVERQSGVGRVLKLARQTGVPVSRLPRRNLDARLGRRAGHQGIAAQVAPLRYSTAESLCARAAADPAAVLVLADGVVDPRNLGAMIRTSAAAGAAGLLLCGGGTVGLTPAAVKVAAGAAERIPVAREARPARRVTALREAGFRVLALDPRGEVPWDTVDLRGRLAVVAGGEERGPSPSVAAGCNQRVAIALHGTTESLNVAVALGVVLFEAVRQRRAGVGAGS